MNKVQKMTTGKAQILASLTTTRVMLLRKIKVF